MKIESTSSSETDAPFAGAEVDEDEVDEEGAARCFLKLPPLSSVSRDVLGEARAGDEDRLTLCLFVCICIYIQVYTYICIRVYRHIYICVHIYMYTGI